jgi:hypothetical protein
MDTSDVEDMLFGIGSSQDDSEGLSDSFTDDRLDGTDDGELSLWDIEDGPLMTPATTDNDVEERADGLATKVQHEDTPTRSAHDR